MANVNLTDLMDRIRPEVSGCPTQYMIQALRDTIRDFCQQTRAWQYESNETITISVSDYAINVPFRTVSSVDYPIAQAIAVEYLTVDEGPCVFRETSWLDRRISNWRNRDADDFRYFTQVKPGYITFPCVPTQTWTTDGVYYRVSVKPLEDATVVDEGQADEWIECWSDGAKARLMFQEGKDWYKPKRGLQCEQAYRLARTRARIRSDRSYGNPEQTLQIART